MKRKGLVLLTIMVMILSLFVTGCGSSNSGSAAKTAAAPSANQFIKASNPEKCPDVAKNRKDTMVVGISAPDGNFINFYAQSMNDVYVCNAMFDGLTDVDTNGTPTPGVAKSWDISKDGKTYTFHLRDDVKYSDGTPLTADDVKFTFEVVCDPSFSGQFDPSTINIKGWQDFHAGKTKDLAGIKVIDPHTVSMTFDAANSSILYQIREIILSKNYYGKGYTPGNTKCVEALLQKPMGCGPYKMTKFIPGQEVDLTANTYYWKGTPKIKNLIFKTTTSDNAIQQLVSGETDIDTVTATPENISQLKAAGFLDLTTFPTRGYNYIGLNLKDPKFSDKNVRQALAYGLNRQQLIKSVFKGQAYLCSEPQSIAHASYLKGVNDYAYNPDKANKMLDAAGWKKGSDGIRVKNGVKFEIHLLASSTNASNNLVIPIVKANFEQLGINVVPEQMELGTVLQKMKSKNFDAYLMGTSIGADVMSDLSGMFQSQSPYNYDSYNNSEYDKLVAQGFAETDVTKRTAIEQQLYKIANEDLPVIFTFQKQDLWACNSRINNMNFVPYVNFPLGFYKAEIK